MTSPNARNLDWIQMLRGVAALLVVFVHARYAMLDTDQWALANQVFMPGAMGVDLFFVISGFIMYYSTAGSPGGPHEALRFFIKRFARVWPVYAAVTLAYVLAVIGSGYFEGNKANFFRSIFFIPLDVHAPPYFSMALPVGWTLIFEMYFYVAFAVSMLFGRLRWFVLASWALLSVILLPLARRGFGLEVDVDLGYGRAMAIASSPFVLEFLAGVLIGWLYRARRLTLRSNYVAAHVMAMGVGFAIWAIYSGVTVMHGPMRWGWPVALMVLCTAIACKTLDLRVPRVLTWLGSISYSLYLTHLLAQHIVKKALIMAHLDGYTHAWSFMFISTVAALPLAALSHHYLEEGLAVRLRDWLLSLLPVRNATRASDAAVSATGTVQRFKN